MPVKCVMPVKWTAISPVWGHDSHCEAVIFFFLVADSTFTVANDAKFFTYKSINVHKSNAR